MNLERHLPLKADPDDDDGGGDGNPHGSGSGDGVPPIADPGDD